MRILIVDDDSGFLNGLKVTLVSNGYQVVAARDGYEALKIVQAALRGPEPIELMITDLRMPGLDGVKLIRSVRELNHGIRTVLITAYGNDTVRSKIRDLGNCGYIEKPFAPEALVQMIEEIRDH